MRRFYCDRCGKEIPEWSVHHRLEHTPPREEDSDDCTWTTYDICSDCAEKFKAWMGDAE